MYLSEGIDRADKSERSNKLPLHSQKAPETPIVPFGIVILVPDGPLNLKKQKPSDLPSVHRMGTFSVTKLAKLTNQTRTFRKAPSSFRSFASACVMKNI